MMETMPLAKQAGNGAYRSMTATWAGKGGSGRIKDGNGGQGKARRSDGREYSPSQKWHRFFLLSL